MKSEKQRWTAQRVLDMSESETLAMARKSRELQAAGKNIINLSLGEPDFDTPDFIKKAAIQAIEENFSHYTPVPGYADLLQAISRKFKRDNHLEYQAHQIVVSTGAKQSIANLCLAVLNPGDEVLVPAPYWVSYREIIRLAGAVAVPVLAGVAQDFKVSAEQLRKAISPKTKMLLFSNPCNPTGAAYSYDELEAWAQVLRDYPNVLVASDEIYERIRFEGSHQSMAAFEGMYERTVTINGLSKGFAMTGWRLGYLAGPAEIAAACSKVQGQLTSATCSISQRAAIAALDATEEATAYMVEAFKHRRDLMHPLLLEIPGWEVPLPPGAFYFFPEVSHYFGKVFEDTPIKDANDLCMVLLEEGGVATVPGDAFGMPGCLRLSYATDEATLREAVRRIKETLALCR